jgi:ribose 5-phosphate isomerase A
MALQLFRGIAERAVAMIPGGQLTTVGLGTGHAATAFIHVLAEHVRAGLRLRGIPTSEASADLARSLGIPLTTFEEADAIDVTFDGADEVDPHGNLIKGYGGALVREKIVAAASKKLVILVGPEKLVPVLGARGKLPVEVVPFALPVCRRRLEALGFMPQPRMQDGALYQTDNGNNILDCAIAPLKNPEETELALRSVPGVVGTGLFLGMASLVLIQQGDSVVEQAALPVP